VDGGRTDHQSHECAMLSFGAGLGGSGNALWTHRNI
jgi:hypothetical protein